MDLGSLLDGLADDAQGKGKKEASGDQLSDLLGSVLGGAGTSAAGTPAPNVPPQGGDEVLGSLSGSISDAPMMGQGGAPIGAPGGAPAGGNLGDLLGSLLGGAAGQGGQGSMPQGSTGDPMGDLLGSLLGGGGSSPAMGGQGGNAMGGMLGGLLGGLMGGGMGGASASANAAGNMGGLNSALGPLADSLAGKIGIPRQVAMTALAIIVPIVMNKLMNSGQGGDPLGSARLTQGQGLSFTREEQDGMVQQLTAQTGLDEQSAAYTLDQAVRVLGAQ